MGKFYFDRRVKIKNHQAALDKLHDDIISENLDIKDMEYHNPEKGDQYLGGKIDRSEFKINIEKSGFRTNKIILKADKYNEGMRKLKEIVEDFSS